MLYRGADRIQAHSSQELSVFRPGSRVGDPQVASFAKQNRLAALVGTKTAGEVLGGANFKLPGGYILRMPVAGWYTWEGSCIEGKGVEPDVIVENSPESLAKGDDEQFEKALEVVTNR